MKRKLTPEDIVYDVHIDNDNNPSTSIMPQYEDIYNKLSQIININKYGYNIYIVDDFTKEKLNDIMQYIKELYKNKNHIEDICYAVSKDEKSPVAIIIDKGSGNLFKESVEEIKKLYIDAIYNFYNSNGDREKELIIDKIQRQKNELIDNLIETSHNEGFEIKTSANEGFSFIPMIKDKLMTENDYDRLSASEKEDILNKIKKLRITSKNILDKVKYVENTEIEKLKSIFKDYFYNKLNLYKEQYLSKFKYNKKAYEYIQGMFIDIEKNVINDYTINYDEDEENIINIINKYCVNVIVDNSKNSYLPVIYEEDPSINNLIGTIEYENQNGSYITDVSLIKAGSILKANGGCLIMRIDSLVNNPLSYYYLKKVLLNEKVTFDYSKSYLDLITLNGLNPEAVDIKEKIILIGDYSTYYTLYNYDNDFKNIFKMKAEFKKDIKIDTRNKTVFFNYINTYIRENKIKGITSLAMDKLAKYLSRKAENRKKLFIDHIEIDKILMISNNKADKNKRNKIISDDILEIVDIKSTLEEDFLDMYRENNILMDVKDKKIGQINGLSVIETGYTSFGKPNRITCTCCKGSGNIIDIQKDSNLSGNIHSKSISILKGLMNNMLGDYRSLSVDFYLCFEQLYGKIEGDSASAAEVLSMLSSLSRIPIKQNMAITGSINQFGEIQPIGGVNEKIEGFFNVCRILDNIEDKGVVIPERNKNSVILKDEVEDAVKSSKFYIYTMENIYDAIEIMMGNETLNAYDIIKLAKNEMDKYRIDFRSKK